MRIKAFEPWRAGLELLRLVSTQINRTIAESFAPSILARIGSVREGPSPYRERGATGFSERRDACSIPQAAPCEMSGDIFWGLASGEVRGE